MVGRKTTSPGRPKESLEAQLINDGNLVEAEAEDGGWGEGEAGARDGGIWFDKEAASRYR